MENNIKFLPVGLLDTNCIFIKNPETETLYIIDPGADAELLAATAEDFYPKRKSTIVLFTHAHVDHISAAGMLDDLLKIDKYYLPKPDKDLFYSPDNNLIPYLPPAQNLPDVITGSFADDFVTTLETPGHTQGSVVYYFKDLNVLISGDTLFKASVGRTDLPGGDFDQLMKSIAKIFKEIPNDARVIPGHGPETTISYEKQFNPYV